LTNNKISKFFYRSKYFPLDIPATTRQ